MTHEHVSTVDLSMPLDTEEFYESYLPVNRIFPVLVDIMSRSLSTTEHLKANSAIDARAVHTSAFISNQNHPNFPVLLRATLTLHTSDCQIRGSQQQCSSSKNEEHGNSQQLKHRQFVLERGHAVVVIAFAFKCCCCCCIEVLRLLFPSRGWVEKSRQEH